MKKSQTETSASVVRRSESLLASGALTLLAGLMLFYGCRAFDPEPVIVNRAPDTYIVGGPAERTGSRFERQLFWYGTDTDGEVVRFIYAITDSTLRDVEDPRRDRDVDLEDSRFDPAEDVTTLVNEPGRVVGYTTKTDSTFLFTIDRGATPSKDVTFHIVAVDDRGAVDPSPARLYFFSNSLSNPDIRFSVSTEEQVNGSPTWVLRWVGGTDGPTEASPEQSRYPNVGFRRKFRVQWEASSQNGGIVGYRYKASQDPRAGFTPVDIEGERQWDPDATEFVYNNDRPTGDFPLCDINPNTGQFLNGEDCPMAEIRLPSDRYTLQVVALDAALVESEEVKGELSIDVNYPPESSIVQDATYPQAQVVDGAGGSIQTFAEGDTIPLGSYVTFQMDGFDRVPSSNGGDEFGEFCCDVRDDESVPEVRFQGQNLLTADEGNRTRSFSSLFSVAAESDTLGFTVGPFLYNFVGRTVDEHGRTDDSPDTLSFVGGFQPRLTDVFPSAGDTLILRAPGIIGQRWPENDVPYAEPESKTLYWDGVNYWEENAPGRTQIPGSVYRYTPRFEGAPHPSEPLTRIQAWSYSHTSEYDPSNSILNGPESADLSFFEDSPSPNVWDFGESGNSLEIFVPSLIWSNPALFDEDGVVPHFRETGARLRRFLGQTDLSVVGRTTKPGDTYPLYVRVVECDACEAVDVPTEKAGRRTEVTDTYYHIFLGIDPQNTGEIQILWPED